VTPRSPTANYQSKILFHAARRGFVSNKPDCRWPTAASDHGLDFQALRSATRGRCVVSALRFQVYDGQHLVGELEDRGRRNVIALKFEGARRVKVGVYATRIEAPLKQDLLI
jgi:hypothetical protein